MHFLVSVVFLLFCAMLPIYFHIYPIIYRVIGMQYSIQRRSDKWAKEKTGIEKEGSVEKKRRGRERRTEIESERENTRRKIESDFY